MPTYHKLVRDKIPQIIKESGKSCEIVKIVDKEILMRELNIKLVEEMKEYMFAHSKKDSIEELADILEIVYALAEMHGSDMAKLERVRKKKEKTHGRFKEGTYLIKVED